MSGQEKGNSVPLQTPDLPNAKPTPAPGSPLDADFIGKCVEEALSAIEAANSTEELKKLEPIMREISLRWL